MVGKTKSKITPSALKESLQLAFQRRASLHREAGTTAYRLFWGYSEGLPGLDIDRYGSCILFSHQPEIEPLLWHSAAQWYQEQTSWSIYERSWSKEKEQGEPPKLHLGKALDFPLQVQESGLFFSIRFDTGTSTGLFLDFRTQRQSLPSPQSLEKRCLNLFAYTGSFSLYAAQKKYQTWTVDLSKTYLEWAKENFKQNQVPTENTHYFFQEDAFTAIQRFRKKGIFFEGIIIDPPSFSAGKRKKAAPFQVKKHLAPLVQEALKILEPQGWLLVSTNLHHWSFSEFQHEIHQQIQNSSYQLLQEKRFFPALDFPLKSSQEFYLKALLCSLRASP
jgi:23S rRNA (cytosine1962-C5)-methyltransferase